ncbi:MAG: AraC family transcriptional regulator [Pseudomonadota bacterium]
MPNKAPLHNAVWAAKLIEFVAENGQAVEPVLETAKIDRKRLEKQDARLPFDQIAAVFEAAADVTGDDLLGFRFAQVCDFRDGGLVSYVGLSSPTLEAAIRNIARYMYVFSEATEIDLEGLEAKQEMVWRYRADLGIRRRQLVEWAATNFLIAARQVTGRRIAPGRVSIVYPRREGQDAFQRFFGCEVNFAGGRNALSFSADQLALPLVSADDKLARLLRGYCEDVLARPRSQASGLIYDLEVVLAARLSSGRANAAEAARELGMSQRTLARRLAEAGTTFSRVIEGLRHAFAEVCLKDSDLSLTEISFLLGYRDASAFSTAFRRWTGRSPSDLRAKRAG